MSTCRLDFRKPTTRITGLETKQTHCVLERSLELLGFRTRGLPGALASPFSPHLGSSWPSRAPARRMFCFCFVCGPWRCASQTHPQGDRPPPRCMPLPALVLATAALFAGAGSFGPGRGAWETASPSSVGLSAAALDAAARAVAERAPERYCLLVARSGRLVHETYYANTSDTKYELDSAAKTFIAQLVGVAVRRYALDVKAPLSRYGVPRSANWNRTGLDFYPEVTAEHLLTQTNGYGLVKPGSTFTYNSEEYIQHLSPLLAAATNRSALEFATTEFAVPLGIPDLFLDDDIPDDGISAGGGQMTTCRSLLRLGQLLLNGGVWPDAGGKPVPLVDREYARQSMRPSFPGFLPSYGYLAWLNADVGTAHCCAPRWGGTKKVEAASGGAVLTCCSPLGAPSKNTSSARFPCQNLPSLANACTEAGVDSLDSSPCHRNGAQYVEANMIGENVPGKLAAAPNDTVVAMGNYAKYLIVIPSLDVAIVTIGHTAGYSAECDRAYDDAQTLSLIWDALAPAMPRGNKSANKKRRGATDDTGLEASISSAPRQHPASKLGATDAAPPSALTTLTAGASTNFWREKDGNWTGSCSCTCPPGQGFGNCFNVEQLPAVPGECSSIPGWRNM